MDSDDKKLTQIPVITSLSDSDLLYAVVNIGTAPLSKAISKSNAFAGVGGGGFNQGFMTNGKISVTVASNNLTVALKTLAGADPSAGDPVQIRIGDVERSITAALSVTKNAATNWCNAGSSELATREIDYFVYIGYNATDGVTIGFSRIPYATIYSEFSATTTNEKYCAISTITNAAASDNYMNIGRFAATLSAGAGYTWTVPTFTGANLIQRPIYNTRILTWQPTYSASGSMTYTTVTTALAEYQISMNILFLELESIGTTGGTANTTLFATTPFGARNYGTQPAMTAWVLDANAVAGFVYMDTSVSNKLGARKYDGTNFALAAGKYINANGKYSI